MSAVTPKKPAKRREKEDPNNTWNMQFMAASKAGNKELMDELIEKGAQVDHVVKDGEGEEATINTPFTGAVRADAIEMCKHLATHLKANVNFEMERGNTALHYAVIHDMMEMADTLMGLQPDTTKKNMAGYTAVQLAILGNKMELAHLLLKRKAFHDFSYRGDGPYTWTQQACVTGDLTLLISLLELGDSVHQRDREGNTLLHLAAVNQHHDIMEELLNRKAQINAVNAQGLTPLFVCVDQAKIPEIVFLLNREAESSRDQQAAGMQLLQRAIFMNNPDVVKCLLENHIAPNSVDLMGNLALHWAASGKNPAIVTSVLEARGILDPKGWDGSCAEINVANKEGNTPLHKACYWGRANILKLLIAKEADPNMKNAKGRTPLMEAARMGHVEAAQELLNFKPGDLAADAKKKKPPKKGHEEATEKVIRAAEIDAEDNDGQTALQIAMACEHLPMVALLIQRGASVHRTSTKFGTLLHHAVAKKMDATTEILLAAGADVNCLDKDHRPPLHIAAVQGYLPLVKMLVERGASKDAQDQPKLLSALHLVCAKKHYEVAEFLVSQANADVNIRDVNQRTPLHLCAESGATDIAELLLTHGALINAVEDTSRTPLHSACDQRQPAVTKVLVAYEADIEAKDRNGWAPIHCAVFSGCTDCTATLLEAGCKLNEPDNVHRTPMLLASQSGKVECGRLLIQKCQGLGLQTSA